MPFGRDRMKRTAAVLAQKGVFIGTSSWKYPGWSGMLYDESRYVYRGKFSQARFNDLCLKEYAEVFKTVCVDAAYYKFPDRRAVEGLVAQVPADFLFSFKVTDEITIRRFSNLPRFGVHANKANEHFLDAELFRSAFLEPCEPFRRNIGLLIFEFSHFHARDFAHGREFVDKLDQFLAQLPTGWRYGVEIRNRSFLHPEYFGTLARHRVAHVYNSWAEMPPVSEQLALPDSRTHPEFLGVRFLLAPGRRYDEAVRLFSPYDRVQEINEAGRAAGAALIKQAVSGPGQTKAFIFVNNRFEGNALETINAMLEMAGVE
jgi:uncharacterized protein YecE (DUF72 family)